MKTFPKKQRRQSSLLCCSTDTNIALLARLAQMRGPPRCRGLRGELGRRDVERRGGRKGRGGQQRRGAVAASRRRHSRFRHAPVGAVKVLVEVAPLEAGSLLLVGGEEAAVAGAEDGFRISGWRRRGLVLREEVERREEEAERRKRSRVSTMMILCPSLSASSLFLFLPFLSASCRSFAPAQRKENASSMP